MSAIVYVMAHGARMCTRWIYMRIIFVLAVISALIYTFHVDNSRREARIDEQMRTIYTATCGGESFDVRFRSKTDGDLITLDGRRVTLSRDSCVIVENYVEPK